MDGLQEGSIPCLLELGSLHRNLLDCSRTCEVPLVQLYKIQDSFKRMKMFLHNCRLITKCKVAIFL